MATKPIHARADEEDFPPLNKRQLASLKARAADLDDPTRHVIVSPFSRRFCLYYAPADGVFTMNHFTPDCFFKRKAEAEAVAKVLRKRGKRAVRSLQVIAVKKTPRGIRFIGEVTDQWDPQKRWKPILKRTTQA